MPLPAFLAAAGPWIGSHLGEIGSALGGAASLGSMFGLGSSGGTSLFDSKYLIDYQKNANMDYTQWLNENGYSQLRKGLESAGYNPLLALGASPQSGGVASANAISGQKQDLSAMLDAMAMISQIQKTRAETKKLETNTTEKFLDNWDSAVGKLKELKEEFYDNNPQAKSFVDKSISAIQNTAKGVVRNVLDVVNDFKGSVFKRDYFLDSPKYDNYYIKKFENVMNKFMGFSHYLQFPNKSDWKNIIK